MKIQFLNGGLANQAFQYIFARYFELSHPGEMMFMDDSYFALHTVHNGYELDKVFGIKPHMLSECFDDEVWQFILEQRREGKSVPQILCDNGMPFFMLSEVGENHKSFNPFNGKVVSIPCNQYFPQILNTSEDIYYHGYWINKQWFERYKSVFLEEFQFPPITEEHNKYYMDKIQTSDSVSMHIRRGDYVTLGWEQPLEIQRKLIEEFVKLQSDGGSLFVFSDDIEWCKEHQEQIGLNRFAHTYFVAGNSNGMNYRDLQLMSQCKSMIMSNSAFCYLAVLLNTKKQFVLNPTNREV